MLKAWNQTPGIGFSLATARIHLQRVQWDERERSPVQTVSLSLSFLLYVYAFPVGFDPSK